MSNHPWQNNEPPMPQRGNQSTNNFPKGNNRVADIIIIITNRQLFANLLTIKAKQ